MATLLVEPVGRPQSARDDRVLGDVRARAADGLAGRTIWSASALPAASTGARALLECLGWAGEGGVTARALAAASAGDPDLRDLATRLEAMLRGAGGHAPLGPAADRTYAEGVRDGDALLGDDVRAGDVVVLHDALTTALAEDVRERGAHAVWSVHATDAPWNAATNAAWSFLRPRAPVDAIVVTWFEQGGRGMVVEEVAAIMPSPGVVAAKEIAPAPPARATPPYEDVAWSSVLADVVQDGRDERVGGMRHARPAVPIR